MIIISHCLLVERLHQVETPPSASDGICYSGVDIGWKSSWAKAFTRKWWEVCLIGFDSLTGCPMALLMLETVSQVVWRSRRRLL